MARRQRDDLLAPADEERIGADDQRAGAALCTRSRRPRRVRARCWPATTCSCSPSARAAACMSCTLTRRVRDVRVHQHADRRSPWAPVRAAAPAAWRPARWSARLTPVTLPPGRLRLATRPSLTGSLPVCEHDRDRRGRRLGRERRRADRRSAAITATGRRTSSAASAGSRSNRPSAQRYSIATLWPSMKPALAAARDANAGEVRIHAGAACRCRESRSSASRLLRARGSGSVLHALRRRAAVTNVALASTALAA